jgi:hypothetical protein
MKRRLYAIYMLLFSVCAHAQTPEQNLRKCMLTEIEKFQPINKYAEEFNCSVGNKKPFKSTPSSGPNPVQISRAGYIFLTAAARETFKISDGGYTEPYISPTRESVSSTIWCRAEDKLYGKSGKFSFVIEGEQQRVATSLEQRKALQTCTTQVEGLWSAPSAEEKKQ